MSADDNQNIIYAHRNIDQIRKMKLHDDTHRTSFATGFNIHNPKDAPPMHQVFDQQFQSKMVTI